MTVIHKPYDEQRDSDGLISQEDSNEVIIVIRDGRVITFIQKRRGSGVEGMYGDGI